MEQTEEPRPGTHVTRRAAIGALISGGALMFGRNRKRAPSTPATPTPAAPRPGTPTTATTAQDEKVRIDAAIKASAKDIEALQNFVLYHLGAKTLSLVFVPPTEKNSAECSCQVNKDKYKRQPLPGMAQLLAEAMAMQEKDYVNLAEKVIAAYRKNHPDELKYLETYKNIIVRTISYAAYYSQYYCARRSLAEAERDSQQFQLAMDSLKDGDYTMEPKGPYLCKISIASSDVSPDVEAPFVTVPIPEESVLRAYSHKRPESAPIIDWMLRHLDRRNSPEETHPVTSFNRPWLADLPFLVTIINPQKRQHMNRAAELIR